MARIARKSDGRRIFTEEFKRRHLDRVLHGELTIAELGRELGIARSLLQRWKRFMPPAGDVAFAGADTGRVAAPVGRLGTAQYIRELEMLVGKQTVEIELLRAEVAACRKGRRFQAGS